MHSPLMGELEGPEGAQPGRSTPEEDKFERQFVPQVWMRRDSESKFYSQNQGQFFWTLLYLGTSVAYLPDLL